MNENMIDISHAVGTTPLCKESSACDSPDQTEIHITKQKEIKLCIGTADPIERIQRWYRAPYHDIKTPLIGLVTQAKKSIDIEIYGFALPELSNALILSQQRGVKVRILFDHTQACGPSEKLLVDQIKHAGIEHYVGSSPGHQIRHSKFMIVDDEWVEIGSLNYSITAFTQNNTVVILKDREIAADLKADWEENKRWLIKNEPKYQDCL